MEDIKIFKSQNLNIILFLCTFALFLVCVAAYFYGIIVMGWTNKLYGIGVFVFGVCMLDPLFNFMRSKIHGKPYAVLLSDEVVIEDGKMTIQYAYVYSFSTDGGNIVVNFKSAEELNRILESGGCVTREKIKELADGQISFSAKSLTVSPKVLCTLLRGRLAAFQLSQLSQNS